jgi:hypothetical protein
VPAQAEGDWRDRAKCFGLDPNLFVPSRPGGSLKRVYAICNGSKSDAPCPVRKECDQFATENGLVGVFGGRIHSQRLIEVASVVQDARPRPV